MVNINHGVSSKVYSKKKFQDLKPKSFIIITIIREGPWKYSDLGNLQQMNDQNSTHSF